MAFAKRSLSLLAAGLFPLSAHAGLQEQMAKDCVAEIRQADAKIAAARKKVEYHSPEGRQMLSTSDRWVNQARRHAAKGESRNCVTAARKGAAQL